MGTRLVMQTDGNVVLHSTGGALWATNTVGRGGKYLQMQTDGNLVLRSASGAALWTNGRSGSGSELVMQADGNLVEYIAGHAVWSSGTGLPPGAIRAGQSWPAASFEVTS
jgi:hypothetical protein